ncbi:MAG: DUF4239 domain-containing protein [Reyranella sp.]|nr:DUF4239 domain-containing protein [Reyranella sp.]
MLMLGGAAAGSRLRQALPEHHLNNDAKDIVRLGTGLVATISALVLGLLINSASNSYEAQRNEVRQMAANIILLDQLVERYGPEARPIRQFLRGGIEPLIVQVWGELSAPGNLAIATTPSSNASHAYMALHELAPQNDAQRSIKVQALQTATDIQRSRLMLFERSRAAIPGAFLAILISWLTMIFVSFSLFTPLNPTSIVALLLIALSAASAIFLILEMGQPFEGLMQISNQALRTALNPLTP